MKTVDYFLEALKYHGGRNDGFLTDQPVGIKLAEDDYIKVRYDAKAMRWIANRPSRIKYSTAKELIKQYRKEYAERLG
jgi:hypothetical protein